MYISRPQRTLSRATSVNGFGYWTDKDVRVEFRPAAEDHGIVFVRGDLDPPVRIPAVMDYRVEVPRRTSLCCGGASVEMVEHVLAALVGLRIDNCEIWVDAAEMPGVDGSSLPFVEALDAVGTVVQSAPRQVMVVPAKLRVGDEHQWIEAEPPRDEASLRVSYHLDFGPDHPIARQSLSQSIAPETFGRELAPARTFLLLEEARWLQSQGLATRATCRDLLVFGADGPIENTLRFEDECVRHKMLDVVGDLALAGCDVLGHITAHRSGHRLNAELVRRLLADTLAAAPLRRSA